MTRELALVRTFVELADTLVDSFDPIDMLTVVTDRCVDVLGVSGAGLLLASPDGGLSVTASSGAAVQEVEEVAIDSGCAPCFECLERLEPVSVPDIAADRERWPEFSDAARSHGFNAVTVLPVRVRGNGVGTLSIFSRDPAGLSDIDRSVAQAFADVAAISLLQHRAANQQHLLNEQLQHALESRVLIEQAKGVLAEREKISLDGAFTKLRKHARGHGMKLADVASGVLDGTIALTQ